MAGLHLIALMAGVAVVLSVAYFGSPRSWLGWWRRLRQARQRAHAEDALKHIRNCGLRGPSATPESLQEALGQRFRVTLNLIARLETQGLVRCSAEGLSLTTEGTRLALQVIRAHRLWERYLVDEARMPLARVHAEAEVREHTHFAEQLDALDAAMGHPSIDPHGAPIPTNRGELAELSVRALVDWPVQSPARIVLLEDEPPAVFAQIAAYGFRPGQIVRVLQADAHRLVVEHGDQTRVLAPVVGANILVTAVEQDAERVSPRRLTALEFGQRATVAGLDQALQGFTRRRLLDLGITPGVAIEVGMSGIFRDPVAYRVRGTLIALRREQAEHVLIKDATAAGRHATTASTDATVRETEGVRNG